ncbi:hypothetical protein F869_22648 [Klebsiella pneumoniae subsp. pneumoniae CIP 52.145 = B5055]|nr:hypothetical protein F869_22648 [Klebsiella pneumoniae subsp. pneumoniae CIP 52.145 = B5055]
MKFLLVRFKYIMPNFIVYSIFPYSCRCSFQASRVKIHEGYIIVSRDFSEIITSTNANI